LVLALPQKVIKFVEKIECGFLWEDRAETNGGHCHVNWRTVCEPISYGGLGIQIQDMERAGLALRMQWLWYSKTDEGRTWSGLDLQFTADEQAFFFASTHLIVGDGKTGNFGRIPGSMAALYARSFPQLACIPKRQRKIRTVADGLQAHKWVCDIHVS
jgi:hypothetical protein